MVRLFSFADVVFAMTIAIAMHAGCTNEPATDPCAEVALLFENGVTPPDDERECRDMLAFLRGPIVSSWPSPMDWLLEVPGQRVRIAMQLVEAATMDPAWSPRTFGFEPATVPPCRGAPVTEERWDSSPLGAAGLPSPESLYASFSLEVLPQDVAADGEHIVIQVLQDFDCDGETATSYVEGIVRPGSTPYTGGWSPIRIEYAPFTE